MLFDLGQKRDQLLSERLRPSATSPESLVGAAAKIWQRDFQAWIRGPRFHCVLWGPPGSGKTTLARMLGEKSGSKFTALSAVRDGVKEIRAAIDAFPGQILFVDEIHRLSKSQQDTLLPALENSEVWLVGATTESPSVSLNPAILSRVRTIYVGAPQEPDTAAALMRGLDTLVSEKAVSNDRHAHLKSLIIQRLAKISSGDVRFGLNLLESLSGVQTQAEEEDILKNLPRSYTDKRHYDAASAMIKSMRGSDPDAALYYAITSLDGGEDPLFILRRCVIFASEDIGNADPQALAVAVNAYRAVECVGMPEGRIPLAQAVTYLASTVKSNRSYAAIETVRGWKAKAEEQVGVGHASLLPPRDLRIEGRENYKYPHDFEDAFVPLEYLPSAIAPMRSSTGAAYKPSAAGAESRIVERLSKLWNAFRAQKIRR